MALFKITSKRSVSLSGGIRLEKGMSVEVIDSNNPLITTRGKVKVREAIKSKYQELEKEIKAMED